MGEMYYEDKVYCCSNTPKAEARKIALFDIIGYFFALIFCSWATDFVKNDPETFRNMTLSQNASLATDFSFLLDFEEEDQNFFFAGLLIWCLYGMIIGTTLLIAAEKSYQTLLKLWFALTILEILLSLFLAVLALMYLERKTSITFFSVMAYLYKWYELWIIYRLTKELRSASTVFAREGNKPYPAFTVNGPTPSADADSYTQSVFTIEGHTPPPNNNHNGRVQFTS